MDKSKIGINLQDIPATMIIPLRARYLESKSKNGIIVDPKTEEILESIDYDFSGSKEISNGSRKGVAIRTEILDELCNNFLSKNPDAVVINMGCGLDTRFHRLDNGSLFWFDLDVPESIQLRKNFFEETDRYKFIAKSVLDFSWMDMIPPNKPTLFIAEGLLMYFSENQVKLLLREIVKKFSGSEMLFEAMSPFVAKRSNKHPDIKKTTVSFNWGIKTGKEIDRFKLGAKFIAEYYYFDRHKDHQSPFIRILALIPAFRKMMKIVHISFD